jgi:hypothetical protein
MGGERGIAVFLVGLPLKLIGEVFVLRFDVLPAPKNAWRAPALPGRVAGQRRRVSAPGDRPRRPTPGQIIVINPAVWFSIATRRPSTVRASTSRLRPRPGSRASTPSASTAPTSRSSRNRQHLHQDRPPPHIWHRPGDHARGEAEKCGGYPGRLPPAAAAPPERRITPAKPAQASRTQRLPAARRRPSGGSARTRSTSPARYPHPSMTPQPGGARPHHWASPPPGRGHPARSSRRLARRASARSSARLRPTSCLWCLSGWPSRMAVWTLPGVGGLDPRQLCVPRSQ